MFLGNFRNQLGNGNVRDVTGSHRGFDISELIPGGKAMNKGVLSLKTWLLTHQLSVWGEAVLVALFVGIAGWIVWEGD